MEAGSTTYREHYVDLVQLVAFLHATRPEVAESLALAEDGQVAFKGRARAFVRTYAFLSAVLPYCNAAWEKRSLFLEFLLPKLPAPREEDFSKEILDAIDMDSYRVEKQATALADKDTEIGPVPSSGASGRPEADLDRLSNIIGLLSRPASNRKEESGWTSSPSLRERLRASCWCTTSRGHWKR